MTNLRQSANPSSLKKMIFSLYFSLFTDSFCSINYTVKDIEKRFLPKDQTKWHLSNSTKLELIR